jgi:hypothetical protein
MCKILLGWLAKSVRVAANAAPNGLAARGQAYRSRPTSVAWSGQRSAGVACVVAAGA